MSSKEWPCCFHGHSIIPTWNILKILCLWSENRTQVNSSWVTEPLTVWIINIHNHATWAFKYVIFLAFCIVICLSLTSQNCQNYIGWPCCFPGHPGAWLAMAPPPPELRVETSLLGKRRRPVVDRQRGRKEVGGGGSLGFWHILLHLQKFAYFF